MSLVGEGAAVIAQLLAGAGLGSFARWSKTQLRVRQPAARLWSLNRARPVHIVTAQDDSDFLSEFTVKVYPAEYLAAVEVRSLLCETLKHPDVDLSTSTEFAMGSNMLRDNLVCIGGPVHNRVTKLLLKRLKLPFSFDEYVLASDRSQRRYEATIDHETGKIVHDFGVVVLDRNPFNESCAVALIMGTRTFGCPAGSQFLTSGKLSATERAMGSGRSRWAILHVDVVDDFVARIAIAETGSDDQVHVRQGE